MNRTVLIVDNDIDILTVLQKGLSQRGYNVISADNGSDTIMLARSKGPDMILLDLLMPDMDGAAVAAMLREDPLTRHIPIVFTTCLISRPEQSQRNNHLIAGHATFAKPYDIDELTEEMEKLMKCSPNS